MKIEDEDGVPLTFGTVDLAAGIQRTASILLERYGAEAVAFATSHVAPLESKGSLASAAHWRSVAAEIERLVAATPMR